VIDSEEPTSILQAAPLRPISVGPNMIPGDLILAAVLWPISRFVKRRYPHPPECTEIRRWRLLLCAAATFEVLYFGGWMMLATPILNIKLWSTATGSILWSAPRKSRE